MSDKRTTALSCRLILVHYYSPVCLQLHDCMQELESWGPRVLQLPSADCEMLYGRCGYLHALLFARKYAGSSPGSQQLIKQLLQQVVEEGQRGAAQLKSLDPDSKWGLMWSWHGSYYLGGVLSTTVSACLQTYVHICTRLGNG